MEDSISLYYCKGIDNFGDELSSYVVEKLAKKSIVFSDPLDGDVFVAIGSLLTYDVIHTSSIVWGTGTLTKRSVKILPKLFPLSRSLPAFFRRIKGNSQKRANILAVRGPLTRKALLDEGIACPEIYGDPAIIMPRLYTPKKNETTKIGLVLHHSQESLLDSRLVADVEENGIKLISIRRKGTEQIESFIDEICSCKKVFSTSLHGLIIAQAYGIPAQWARVQGTPIHSDESHKFKDYFLGVGQDPQTPYGINLQKDSFNNLIDCPVSKNIIPKSRIEKLLSVFPY